MSHLDLGPPPPAKGLQRPNGQYTVHIWEDIVFEEWVIGFVERFEHCQVIASIVCISLGIKQIGAVAFISILQKFAIYFVPMRQQETKVGGLRTAVTPALLLVCKTSRSSECKEMGMFQSEFLPGAPQQWNCTGL